MLGPRIRVLTSLLAVALGAATEGASAEDLLQLHARAVELDPQFRGTHYQRDLARQALREAKGGVQPVIVSTAEGAKIYQDIKSSQNILFQVGDSNFRNNLFTISLTQPVYRADALARLPQARAQVRQAELQLTDARQDLIIRLAEAHFEALAARDGLDLARAERRAIERQLLESEERLSAGLGTMTDVHEARARFALARAAEITAADSLEESYYGLAEIVGEVPDELLSLSESFPLVQPDRPEVDSWVEAAMFQNPRVKAVQESVDAAAKEIGVQRAARLPSLDLVASFTNNDRGGSELGGGGGSEINTRDVRLSLRIPIWDGGRSLAATRSASLQQQIAVQRLELLKRRVQRETRSSFQGVMGGITRVEALRQSVFSQEAALSARREELRAGLSTGLDVLDALRELFAARRDVARARYEYILDSLRLKQAVGILGVADLEQINAYLQ